MNCESSSCGKMAWAKVTWATTLPPQTFNLCEEHVDELWKMLNPLVQLNIPKDLLHRVETYEYRMELTRSESIDDLTSFARYFGKDFVKKSEGNIVLNNEYETFDLPTIHRLRCRAAIPFTGTELFGDKGCCFSFGGLLVEKK